MLIKLTSFFTRDDIYVNTNRISTIDKCKTDDESVKTRINCPKPIYVTETPEEIVKIIDEGILKGTLIAWDSDERINAHSM